jgi:hypothetical protein
MGNTHKRAIGSLAADNHVNNISVWIGKVAYTHTHTLSAGEKSAENTFFSSGDIMVCNPELHPKCALKGPYTLSSEK